MRKLKLKMTMSMDGFVCGLKGESEWVFKYSDKQTDKWEIEIIRQAGIHIMGSRTFRDMKSYWPTATGIFAKPMNEIPKIAFSRKGIPSSKMNQTTRGLKGAEQYDKHVGKKKASSKFDWDETPILTGNLATEIKKLKAKSGKTILAYGGATFAQSLIKTGLVDEFHLLVLPVAIGKGLPIFTKLDKLLYLKLVNSTKFKNGAVGNVYKPG